MNTAAGAITDAKRQRQILIAMCTALVAVIASVSGLNVAQQDLGLDLNASQGTILWIINAYTLALAALLLPIGAIGDRWGRKPVLLTGLAVFGAASIAAGLAQSSDFMIVARVFAGIGAAMIMPVTLSVITSSFPEEERANAIGVWAGFAGAGGIIGLFVSSFMVDVVNWRWLFAVPVLLVAASAYMTMKAVPNSSEDSDHPFDFVGGILSAVGIFGLVLGIHEGPEKGWGATITVASMAVGIVAIIAFVLWELKQDEPLLDVTAFSDRNLAAGAITLLVLFAVMFGIFLVLFPFLQAVVGWSALRSASGMLPMALVMMPLSAVSPRIAAKIGHRAILLIGVATFGGGLALLAMMASVDGGYLSILPGLVVIGTGMGLTMTSCTEAITATLPPEKQGVASALNDTSREIGGAVGVALLGSILNAGYRSSISDLADTLPEESAEVVREGIAGALGVAAQSGEQGPTIALAAQQALVDGWVQSMWIAVGIVGAAFAYLVLRGPAGKNAIAEERELVNAGS